MGVPTSGLMVLLHVGLKGGRARGRSPGLWHFEPGPLSCGPESRLTDTTARGLAELPGGAEPLPVGAEPRARPGTAHATPQWGAGTAQVLPAPSEADRNSRQLGSPVPSGPSPLRGLQPSFQPRMKQLGSVGQMSPSGLLGNHVSPPPRHSAVISTDRGETLACFSGSSLSRFGKEVTVSLQPLVTQHPGLTLLTSR